MSVGTSRLQQELYNYCTASKEQGKQETRTARQKLLSGSKQNVMPIRPGIGAMIAELTILNASRNLYSCL
jgi:hypothetical protein